MKLEHKSLLIGVIIGFGSVFLIFFILGNIKTEFTLSIGKQDEKVRIDQKSNQDHIILSYNIKYDDTMDKENNWSLRKKRLLNLLKDYNPSIIGIQEGLINQVNYIDTYLEKYKYIGAGRDDGKTKGEFCAIYFDTTFYEVLEHSTFWLSETPDLVSVGWDAALERVCTYGLFVSIYSGEKFLVLNTHFDHIGTVARIKSSELILNKIKEINKNSLPVVLMGDFNSIPDSEPIKIIEQDMIDGLRISLKNLQGPQGTFNGFDLSNPISKRIDYIFTKNFQVLYYRHIDDRLENNNYISDHLPVMAVLKRSPI
ncbi:MAG: endonuclease/exonuclease/phosphatase family protein [Candidatus Neomarinimicrobiota bacterium]|tara:strand:+ start:1093 stop:2028 length:936 start_codon:yes stop_codon:yes gene_type:complete